jgi:hypothetical protein
MLNVNAVRISDPVTAIKPQGKRRQKKKTYRRGAEAQRLAEEAKTGSATASFFASVPLCLCG